MAFRFINYQPTSYTSTGPGQLYQRANLDYYVNRLDLFNWESYPHSQFPQELVIQLEHRAEVAHIVLQSKLDMEIGGLTIYIGDQLDPGSSDTFASIKFRLAGSSKQIGS